MRFYLALAGLPPKPEQHRDGVNITPVLRGEATPKRDALCWHYPHYHGSTWTLGSAMREGDWKLIAFFEEDAVELYNLKSDLSERCDLAAVETQRVRVMRAKLAAWRAETSAYLPGPGDQPLENKTRKRQ